MKLIKRFSNGYINCIPESAKEALYEKGDFIEVEYEDYKIFDYYVEDGHPVYQAYKL